MALRPSSVPQRVPLPSPPASSLADGPDPESDLARAATLTVTRLLATVVTDPLFDSAAASALVAELVDFAAAYRLDYAASLVAESESDCPPSARGECALGTNVLEDRQEDFECFAAAVPHLVSILIAPKGDPDAPDIPTPRSYAEAITVPPLGANIVDGMWIFRVKRPPDSPPAFKARYRDYELHSLDFSTAFLEGSQHEEIRLRRPPGFTGSFPASTQWSLRWPVYGLRQAPREWHETLRTTLAALGFAPSTTDPSLFLCTDTLLPPTSLSTSFSASASGTPRHCPLLCLPITRSQLHLQTIPTSGMELVLGGRGPVVLTGHADASWIDDLATQRSSQGYTLSLGSGSELRWLTYLLTDLGERPRSSPVLYVDNKAMVALCQEHRLEHRTKHIALRYFLARELQQRG
ncbi:unnamed protein product [Closterium sp. NIES-53]